MRANDEHTVANCRPTTKFYLHITTGFRAKHTQPVLMQNFNTTYLRKRNTCRKKLYSKLPLFFHAELPTL